MRVMPLRFTTALATCALLQWDERLRLQWGLCAADAAFQEFRDSLERGVEPLPSAALTEPEEQGERALFPG